MDFIAFRRTSVILVLVNTLTLGVMLAISGVTSPGSFTADVTSANRSTIVLEAIANGLTGDGWSIAFYATLFLLSK